LDFLHGIVRDAQAAVNAQTADAEWMVVSSVLPAGGIRLPFSWSGEFGTSPFFGQLSVKAICLTVRQRTAFLRHKIVDRKKLSAKRYAQTTSGLLFCSAVVRN
jgi:hypothetical protein